MAKKMIVLTSDMYKEIVDTLLCCKDLASGHYDEIPQIKAGILNDIKNLIRKIPDWD